ncbi:thiamine-phosphate kinase [Nesterenkonia sp. Act20]|uniref:thiamine-phosphate kinase n=1 Tax=Nesterenkonia sp. Act20 TaxID=1483432 RepID=UPI001C44162B|nr:thiamine-phosphate kinase [Nesterenkonia sp. Act20]
MSSARDVGAAGEDAVIEIIMEELDGLASAANSLVEMTLPPGDDAAVLKLPDDGEPARIVLTTDTLSQDQDFRLEWWSTQDQGLPAGRAVGLKAAAQNLSDLNAMAATPISLLVSLTLPSETPLDWVRGFYRGLAEALQTPGVQGCVLAGGDLGSGPGLSVSITAVGRLPASQQPLTRVGAHAGDQVAVSAALGRAAAGLALLEAGHDCAQEDLAALRDAQIAPRPALTTGAEAVQAGATAGMDLSDGLLRDAARLARASGVRIRVDEAALRAQARALGPAAVALDLPEAQTLRWAAAGGEDYALLTTFPAEAVLPVGFFRVGEVLAPEDPQEPGHADGAPDVIFESAIDERGWDSMRA